MDAVEMLQSLVSIPSLSGEEAAVARFLVDRMEQLGFDARIDEAGNAVGMLGDGPRDLVLLGHMDTVPGGPAVEIRGGRLYGRGAVDAKGPLATFVMAAAGVGAIPGWRIIVIGAVEEEVAASKGARHVARAFRPEACVIGEPSGWDGVTLGYKGRLVADVRCRQPTVHGATEGPSASERLVDYWNIVAQYVDSFNQGKSFPASSPVRVFDRLQRRLQGMESSLVGDEEVARASIGFRLPPGLSPEVLKRTLEDLRGGDDEFELTFSASEFAYVEDRRSPLVGGFLHALRDAGIRPRLKVKTGTSDMNVVGPIWQCPIVAYGPGDSNLDHTPEEHIELDEYLKAIKILQGVLRRLEGHPSREASGREFISPR